MALGIAGRGAIVCASSSGLGRACAEALVAEGVNVVINGRDGASLQRVADEIAVLGAGTVVPVAADITTDAGRAALLAACPAPDMLVLNNRGPKPGDLAEAIGAGIEEGLDLHYRAPLALVDAVLGGMRDRRFGRIVTITSAMVASPRSGMTSSAGARAGQWAVLKALARDVVADGVTINNLLPERFATQRQIDNASRSVAREGVSFDDAWAAQAASLPIKRHGEPGEFGATCAFVCSAHAAFMTGMSIRLDGGSYHGLL